MLATQYTDTLDAIPRGAWLDAAHDLFFPRQAKHDMIRDNAHYKPRRMIQSRHDWVMEEDIPCSINIV